MVQVKKVKMIEVRGPNRVGVGAEIFGAVAASKVNIVAVCAWEEGMNAVLLLDTDGNARAKAALRKSAPGYAIADLPCLAVSLPNRAGALADILRKIALARINVAAIFATVAGKSATVYVRTVADARAIQTIAGAKKGRASGR